ncbi:LysR family transcriptional regulator [Nosocomiicoccus ampullae]|uniref:LysR family transcriptional regulator n=1 Tax=Nosocomiicoccus ampullae TaxID=489910 RepID=UPI00254C2672|nr:LysR family transcriptional regulator [Nosocomiicoccus ampullae]MDK6864023.1 LysR family transcriptional regulator [Nosocomiicoccus ampullae]
MDYQKLHYFIKVVETGSLLKASESLHMTQPPLSLSIKKLEADLEVKLFERVGKKLVLTGAGHVFYKRAKELVKSTEDIVEEVQNYQAGRKGEIRIGCSSNISLTLLPKVMEKLNQLNLDYVINVTEGNASYILESLKNNDLDIGIVRSVFKKEDMTIQKLYSEPLMLALPKEHKLMEKREPICISELKDEKFLMQSTTYGYNISELFVHECNKHGFYPNIVYMGSETLPILNMVQKGLGIAVAPKSFSEIDNFNLPHFKELKDNLIESTLSVVTYNNKIEKASTEKFIELLYQCIT